MNRVRQRLIGLNLALLMLASCVFPASAATEQLQFTLELNDYSYAQANSSWQEEQGSDSDEPYSIVVDGVAFDSSENQSGDGWTYDPEKNYLELCDYNGGSIYAEGDLRINSCGDVIVSGADGSRGENAIEVEGRLVLRVSYGTLMVIGGSGKISTGKAILVHTDAHIFSLGESIELIGGDATYSRATGAHALYAKRAYLHGDNITLIGGDGYDSVAGCGVYAESVYIEADCSVQGGTGSVDAPAIYFRFICTLGVINATFTSGGDGVAPIQRRTSVGVFHYSSHTMIELIEESQLVVKTNIYSLLLHGNGGYTDDGDASVSFSDYYGASYNLSDFVFWNEELIPMGWTENDTDGAWVALNAVYCPATSTELYLYWEWADAGDILINGMGGVFEDESYYQKYSDTEATLPEELACTSLLAWGTDLSGTTNRRDIYDGIWYAGGDCVQPDSDQATLLYAKTTEGTHAVYHPTQGTVKRGGTIVLQGCAATDVDLQTHTLTQDWFYAPDGYELAGWALSEDGEVIYEPGDAITLPQSLVTHLYAVWTQVTTWYNPMDGVEVAYMPMESTLQATISSDWCVENAVTQGVFAVFDDTGSGLQMITCDMGQFQSGEGIVIEVSLEETIEVCGRIYLLDENYLPVANCISFELSDFVI